MKHDRPTSVARIERSETRGSGAHCAVHPGFAPLDAGLRVRGC